MDLGEALKNLSARIPSIQSQLETEEATKNALVMPFINALGYDVFNPLEVVPEFTADIGTKKGEKVDYAILLDGKPSILFECKTAGVNLGDAHASQLYRYFSVTDARFGILTNGVEYRFYSDLDEPNKMDSRPFLEFDLLHADDAAIASIKLFAKDGFAVDPILAVASDLKYTKGIKRVLSEEWVNPSEDMVKLFVSRVYDGRFTQSVRDQFTDIVKKAFQDFVSDHVNRRLRLALERDPNPAPSSAPPESESADPTPIEVPSDGAPAIVTTEEEVEAFYIVKAIVREVVDGKRVFMRDTQSYCGILLDDNNRKPICRLLFNSSSNKYIGLFDKEKNLTRHDISSLDDIYNFADQLKQTATQY